MTFNNDQWQEAIVQLANSGITVAPASDVQATGTISADQGAVSVTFGTGVASWSVEATGTFSAGTTLFFEFQMTGSGAWYPAFGVPIGSTTDVAVSSVAGGASITYQGNAAGFQAFRVRAHPFAGGDSVVVKIVGSVATDGGFVSKSLPPGTNTIGTVNVQHGNVVSTINSSTTILGSNAVFTGTSESSLLYSAISVEVFADQASAANGLSIQQSQDGTNWDTTDTFSVVASTPFQTSVNLVGQNFRVVYTNGATGQGAFRLQVVKQAAESVVPRALSKLGNMKIALSEIGGVATQMAGSDGNTASNVPIFMLGVSDGSTHVNQIRGVNGIGQSAASNANMPGVGPYAYNGTNMDVQRNNLDNISLIAASGTTTTQTGADQTNYNGKGVIVVLDMTTVGTGSVTLEIDGKDPVSGKYFALLTGAAVVTNSTNVYQLYPGVTVATNAAVSSPLPRTWRVKVTANNANAVTYTCGAMVMR